jgi:hypothetical protein
LSAGGTATATAIVSSINNLTGTVALGCTAPGDSLATCTVAPAVVSLGGTAQISIATTAATKSVIRSGLSVTSRVIAAGGLCGLFSLCFVRRSRRMAALLVLMFAAVLASGGCGLGQVDSTGNSSGGSGSAGTGTTTSGTPLGTYNFTITAASVNAAVNARHTYTLPVTVQ